MTLWDRIERGKRVQSAVLLLAAAATASFVYAVAAMPLSLLAAGTKIPPLISRGSIHLTWVDLLALAIALCAFAGILRPRQRIPMGLLHRLNAHVVSADIYPEMRCVLHDMKVAAGLPKMPTLYVLDSLEINAALLPARDRLLVLVTHGFATRLPRDEQRAVLASLLGRHAYGRLHGLYALAMLVEPAHALQMRLAQQWGTALRDGPSLWWSVVIFTGVFAPFAFLGTSSSISAIILAIIWSVITGSLALILSTWLVTILASRMNISLAHQGDVEGMMLLKDPRSMLRAIRSVVDADHEVVFAQGCGGLFFCWPRKRMAFVRDPEAIRFERLKSLLGAQGLTD